MFDSSTLFVQKMQHLEKNTLGGVAEEKGRSRLTTPRADGGGSRVQWVVRLVHFSTVGVGLKCARLVVEERAVCTAHNPIYKLCLYSVHSVS